ncbi:TPA: hypothetical protein DCX16_02495 [bacterium]|nr:hypothetical protein [bacterium]
MIAELEKEDIDQVKAIFTSFPHHFNKLGLIQLDEDLVNYIELNNYSKICFFVEKETNQVLGVIGYKRRINPYEFEITWLAVRRDVQKKGIGKKLFLHLEERVKSIGCETLIVNVPDDIASISFYEKMGFIESGELSSDNKLVYKKITKTWRPTFKPREVMGGFENE